MSSTFLNIVEVNCRCCGESKKQLLEEGLRDIEDGVPGRYNISKCVSCQLIYLSRTPDIASLDVCYPKHYHVRADREANPIAKFMYRLKKQLRFKSLMAAIERAPNSLLEVGCGDGSFLAYLEEKWPGERALVGTDISVSTPPDGSKVKYIESDIKSLNLGQQFDVVIMYQVLEHLADPVGDLKRISDCLKPGGILIGEVPNWNTPWRRIFPRHWGGLQIPRHQNFFDAKSLETVLRYSGFRLDRMTYSYDPGDLSVSLCNWIADTLKLEAPPRQTWFYIPVTVFSALIVFVQLLIFPETGILGFKARKG